MTLIAFHAQAHRADIVTDTLAYASNARRLSHTSKLMLLPHLDAALLTQGSTTFGRLWWFHATTLASRATSFDDFNDRAGDVLATEWQRLTADVDQENHAAGAQATTANTAVFNVGYSPRAAAFTAVAFASDDGFHRHTVQGLHVMPSPLNVRPSDLELHRLEAHFHRNFDDATPVASLRHQPRPTAPTTAEGWVALAKTVREHRALVPLHSGFKTYIGGDVVHTTLMPGSARQRRVHTFDDHGPEFARMMADSLHPAGQTGPCGCESGLALVDCCLQQIAHQQCPCGSGQPFADCCSVRAAQHTTATAQHPALADTLSGGG